MRSTTDLRTLKRRFTIIASDYVAAVFASALTKKLAVLAPDVSLSILPYTREALRQFQRGTIDFLIGPDFALETKHSAELLFEDRFKCVLWKENSFANTAMTPEDFFDAPMILTNFFLETAKAILKDGWKNRRQRYRLLLLCRVSLFCRIFWLGQIILRRYMNASFHFLHLSLIFQS